MCRVHKASSCSSNVSVNIWWGFQNRPMTLLRTQQGLQGGLTLTENTCRIALKRHHLCFYQAEHKVQFDLIYITVSFSKLWSWLGCSCCFCSRRMMVLWVSELGVIHASPLATLSSFALLHTATPKQYGRKSACLYTIFAWQRFLSMLLQLLHQLNCVSSSWLQEAD